MRFTEQAVSLTITWALETGEPGVSELVPLNTVRLSAGSWTCAGALPPAGTETLAIAAAPGGLGRLFGFGLLLEQAPA